MTIPKSAMKRGNAQGTVYRRENVRWAWQVTLGFDTAGKQCRRTGTCTSKTEANKAVARVVSDHARGRLALPNQLTVGDWLERWLDDRKPRLADNTHASYETLLRRHVIPWIGHHRLQSLRPTDLRQYYSSLAANENNHGKTLSARTLRYVHGLIYSALKDALRLEIIERNVAEIVKPEVRTADRTAKATQAWTAEETAGFLLANEHQELYPPFALMIALGLRRGEVLGLRWEHVNLDRRTLRVVETLISVRGKIVSSQPKTLKSRRTLRLALGLAEMLRAHRTRLEARFASLGILPERDWVFTTVTGTAIHPDNVERTLKQFAKRAGVRIIRVHDLRHTYASLARRQGVSLEIVSEKLGHSRASFTVDVYRHTFEDEHEAATLELSELTAQHRLAKTPYRSAFTEQLSDEKDVQLPVLSGSP